MYAHERSLVQKYEGQPFTLLGINSDPIDEIKEIYNAENITWRSWIQGGTDGPIPTKWNITSWPTIFLIDHDGIIRHRLGVVSPSELDELIDELMAKVE
jgi:hypothetical protein